MQSFFRLSAVTLVLAFSTMGHAPLRSSLAAEGPVDGVADQSVGGDDDEIVLDAIIASLANARMSFDRQQNAITGWQEVTDTATWTFTVDSEGAYDVQAIWSLANSSAAFTGNRYEIELDGKAVGEQLAPRQDGYVNPGGNRATTTGSWDRFEQFLLGQVSISPGTHQFVFRPAAKLNGEWLRLRSIRLVPVIQDGEFREPPLEVASGFTVEVVAKAPLVKYPMMACLDDRGRLFVAESSGSNASGVELLQDPPHEVLMLEDTDNDGRFDKRTIFADKLTSPSGVAWYDNALYVCSAPYLWKLQDSDGDGIADSKSRLPVTFNFNGNYSGMHGPTVGPDGRLYWCGGVHGWKFSDESAFGFEGPWSSQTPGAFAIWPDGSKPEVVGHGGRANPVEVAFTENGDPLGTVAVYDLDEGRHDALLHWTDGSVFNLMPGREIGLKKTGEPLTPVSRRGHVAPSGVVVYRSHAFGKEYEGNVFLAEFNTHSVQRLVLSAAGSSFDAADQTFLASTSPYTHFTDVLEDADGSLLVVDTGGWFVRACPTSRIAKPEIRGAIYRIRKTDAAVPSDPRGHMLDWATTTDSELVGRLGDERFAVRDRAMMALVNRGESATTALSKALLKSTAPATRRQAVWTLCRMRSPAANQWLRVALVDQDLDVRLSAAHSLATLRDSESGPAFSMQLHSPYASERRLAATGLGRIRSRESVPALLDSFRDTVDPVLEHALTLALIRINAPEETVKGLSDPNPNVCKAALIALDQMDQGNLSRDQVLPLVNSSDTELQRTAIEVISRHKSWSTDIAALLRTWLSDSSEWESRKSLVQATLVAFANESKVQDLITESLFADTMPVDAKLMLLDIIANSDLEHWPVAWTHALKELLKSDDVSLLQATVTVISNRNVTSIDSELLAISNDREKPNALRVASLCILAERGFVLDDAAVNLLISQVSTDTPPLERLKAATAIGETELTAEQADRVASLIATSSPLELPIVLAAFKSKTDAELGDKLIQSISQSSSVSSLSANLIRESFHSFPKDVQDKANQLVEKLFVSQEDQAAHLLQIESEISEGDPVAGRAVFFGAKASCSACHRINRIGGEVGPNLSEIARIRSTRDLLESILYPSATLARDYETFNVVLSSGKIIVGTIQRETADVVHLRTTQREQISINRKDIEEVSRSSVSIMPQGLEKTISKTELDDLVSFLKTLK